MAHRERIYRLSKAARIAVDVQSCVLLDTKRGRYYSLTATAKQICEGIAEGASFKSTFDRIQQRYTVPPEQIARDLDEFLRLLVRLGLCHVQEI